MIMGSVTDRKLLTVRRLAIDIIRKTIKSHGMSQLIIMIFLRNVPWLQQRCLGWTMLLWVNLSIYFNLFRGKSDENLLLKINSISNDFFFYELVLRYGLLSLGRAVNDNAVSFEDSKSAFEAAAIYHIHIIYWPYAIDNMIWPILYGP